MDIAEVNRAVIEQFRAGGPVDGMHRERLLLLTTVGAASGESRTTPMMFHADGDRVLVMASNMGAPADPHWYRNLVADPRVTVEIDAGTTVEAYAAVATPLEGAERDRVWAQITAAYPFFADHEAVAGRTIPVVALGRV